MSSRYAIQSRVCGKDNLLFFFLFVFVLRQRILDGPGKKKATRCESMSVGLPLALLLDNKSPAVVVGVD